MTCNAGRALTWAVEVWAHGHVKDGAVDGQIDGGWVRVTCYRVAVELSKILHATHGGNESNKAIFTQLLLS